MDCRPFSNERIKCHAVYGKLGEDCLHEELTEKRCLSLLHCPKQAKAYYGDAAMTASTTSFKSNDGYDNDNNNNDMRFGVDETSVPSFMIQKAICASWAESFAYGGGGGGQQNNNNNQELVYGKKVVKHHQDAKEYVSSNSTLKRECRDIAFHLARCLQSKKIF